MQPTQQPVQAKPAIVQNPAVTVQTQQPVAGQPVKKKPTRWWILVIVAIVIIGGGIWAYFQFLS